MPRKYSDKTLKILFGLSGNQCAHPDCTTHLITEEDENSSSHIIAQVCHIRAHSARGPRGNAGLSSAELNSVENLILFCRNHHGLIDDQPENYPPELLKRWKHDHEVEMRRRVSTRIRPEQQRSISGLRFPTELVDKAVNEQLATLCQSRFFGQFDSAHYAVILARRLTDGDLSGSSDDLKCRALSWCVRVLATPEHLKEARAHLHVAKSVGRCSETEIAEALIASREGYRNDALTALGAVASPASRSAALSVVADHDGADAAIDWMKTARLEVADLDADGKCVLLALLHTVADWHSANHCLDAITDEDLQHTPVLHYLIALTLLVSTVTEQLRATLLNQIPLLAAEFPLASDDASIQRRRIARGHFIRAEQDAQELNCPESATQASEYALWIDLTDPDNAGRGLARLKAELRNLDSGLRYVPLAVQFDVSLNTRAIEEEIERKTALNGQVPFDGAVARFALAFKQPGPEAVASYIERHIEQLSVHIDRRSMACIQVEMLARSGRSGEAKERLGDLVNEGLHGIEEKRLRSLIQSTKGEDAVDALIEQFSDTESVEDLSQIVMELERLGEWQRLCVYARILFEETGAVRDATRLAVALTSAQRSDELVEFVGHRESLRKQSDALQLMYCWALYYEGKLMAAQCEQATMDRMMEDENYRSLRMNLGISLGDWASLGPLIEYEYESRGRRSAEELLQDARLAIHLGLPRGRELLMEVAGRGADEAEVLAAAHLLAVEAGWEGEGVVQGWLRRALELSGTDGPLRPMSISDLVARKPSWERQTSKTWDLLRRGELPMFAAAGVLNRSLASMMILPAVMGGNERDPRRRAVIPAYSGGRESASGSSDGVLGLDPSALLTLGYLDLLEIVLDSVDKVMISHGTMHWLFEERQTITFHQPSRIREAHRLRDILSEGKLEKVVRRNESDGELDALVGEDLGALLREAVGGGAHGEGQSVVVRPYPVIRVGSLLEQETVDLTEYEGVLTSCGALVEGLTKRGQLTEDERTRSRAYLKVHEEPWPREPEIADGATLYLDDLAVAYLHHLGLLERLSLAGFRSVLSERCVEEVDEMIAYESRAQEVEVVIERIRSAVSARIATGRVLVNRRTKSDTDAGAGVKAHPSFDFAFMTERCDGVVVDDRFFNKHGFVGDDDGRVPILTTLDLIGSLVAGGRIDAARRRVCYHRLRRSGFLFVPVNGDDLRFHLTSAEVRDGTVVEGAELRAIRENMLQARMGRWLQLPREAVWVDAIVREFIDALRSFWESGDDVPGAGARSTWILNQIDARGWAQSLGGVGGQTLVREGRAVHLPGLCAPLPTAGEDSKRAYWKWLEEKVLRPVKEEDGAAYASIVDKYRQVISVTAEAALRDQE